MKVMSRASVKALENMGANLLGSWLVSVLMTGPIAGEWHELPYLVHIQEIAGLTPAPATS